MIKIPLENIIPLSDARTNFSKIIEEAVGKNAYLITKGGKPAVIIASAEAVEHLVGSDKILAVEEKKAGPADGNTDDNITQIGEAELPPNSDGISEIENKPTIETPTIEELEKTKVKSIGKDGGTIKNLSPEELFNVGTKKGGETDPGKTIEDELKNLKPAEEKIQNPDKNQEETNSIPSEKLTPTPEEIAPEPEESTPTSEQSASPDINIPKDIPSENTETPTKNTQEENPVNNTENSNNSAPEDSTSKLNGIDLDALRRKKEEEENPPRPEETPIIRQDSYFYSGGNEKGKNKESDFGL